MAGFTTFVAGTVAALGVYGGVAVLLDGGFTRRLLIGISLLWIAGWIAVVPSTTAEPPWLSYATAVAVGTLLAGGAAAMRLLDRDLRILKDGAGTTHLFVAGGATAGPGVIGLLLGAEVLVLMFVVTVAVVVILLFLFR